MIKNKPKNLIPKLQIHRLKNFRLDLQIRLADFRIGLLNLLRGRMVIIYQLKSRVYYYKTKLTAKGAKENSEDHVRLFWLKILRH